MIAQHIPYIKKLIPTPTSVIKTGDVIYFSYNGVYRYLFVISPDYKSLLHGIHLTSLTREDIRGAMELVWKKTTPYQLYYDKLVIVENRKDGYRSYKKDKMKLVMKVEYDYWTLKDSVYVPGVFYYNPTWGKTGAMLVTADPRGLLFEQILQQNRIVKQNTPQLYLEIMKKIGMHKGVFYRKIDNTIEIVDKFFKERGTTFRKFEPWTFTPTMVKKIKSVSVTKATKYASFSEEDRIDRISFELFLSFAKRTGGVYVLKPEYLSYEKSQTIYSGLFV